MKRARAICRLLSPLTRRASTSASRSVRSNWARAAAGRAAGEPGGPVSLARRAKLTGQGEQGRRRKLAREALARGQGACGLLAPARPDRGSGLAQAGVGLPVGLAKRLPGIGYRPPRRPVVAAPLAGVLGRHQRPERGHLRLTAAMLIR